MIVAKLAGGKSVMSMLFVFGIGPQQVRMLRA